MSGPPRYVYPFRHNSIREGNTNVFFKSLAIQFFFLYTMKSEKLIYLSSAPEFYTMGTGLTALEPSIKPRNQLLLLN